MRKEVKLCINCKHYHPDDNAGVNSCYAEQNKGEQDLLTGDFSYRYCAASMRTCGWIKTRILGLCGEEARWFEPKIINSDKQPTK
jgi:hypothetical protein